MEKISPKSALFIKLGRGGEYEQECLTSPGKVRVGWNNVPHEICFAKDWEVVKQIELSSVNSHLPTATNLTNQIRSFYESEDNILWITFYKDRLYWCFADTTIVPLNDGSRFRNTCKGWYDTDIQGKKLDINRLSGSLLAIQGFRSTICKVREFDYLLRKINCDSSPTEQNATIAYDTLVHSLESIIHNLNWKEFELLTDLIFREAGWQRLGVLGKSTKDIDLDLLSPIANEHYKVQVKSAAGKRELEAFQELASDNQEFAQYYFVVHKPDPGFLKIANNPIVKIWLPEDIARLSVTYGLANWLISKAK